MNKILSSTILIIGLSYSLFSQTVNVKDTLYLDENKKEIFPKEFHEKVSSAVFYSKTYEVQDMVINKVSYQYYFGKITPQKRNELQTLLNNLTSLNIKDDENILIQYFDTLQNYQGRKRLYEKHFTDYHFTIVNKDTIVSEHKPLCLNSYKKNNEKFQHKLTKCSTKLKKRKNTKVVEMYNIDTGYSFQLEKLTWVKDPGVFKENFFINIYENNLLIIKPNGDFFMKQCHIKNGDLFDLLKTNDWSEYFSDWEKSIITNSSKGYGIIKSLYSIYNGPHPDHCY